MPLSVCLDSTVTGLVCGIASCVCMQLSGWMREYALGSGKELYSIKLHAAFHGVSFRRVSHFPDDGIVSWLVSAKTSRQSSWTAVLMPVGLWLGQAAMDIFTQVGPKA